MALASSSSLGSPLTLICSSFSTSSSPVLVAAAAVPFLPRGFLTEVLPTFPVRLETLVGVLESPETGASPFSVELLLPPLFSWEQRREYVLFALATFL